MRVGSHRPKRNSKVTREPSADTELKPRSGRSPMQASEAPEQGSEIDSPNFEGTDDGADDWDEFITITYDPTLDCSRPIRCAENSGGGEPLQTGGEQEDRVLREYRW